MRSRRNYSTSVKRARTPTKHDRKARSAREERAHGLAQRAAWLNQRSTQARQVSSLRASRGLTASTDRRSASDLEAALARRRAWIGDSSRARDPSATDNITVAPADAASPRDDAGMETQPADGAPAPLRAPGDLGAVGDSAARTSAQRHEEALVRDALTARGIHYRWGGTSRGGFDCSGFTRYLMARHLGITLPHSASAQSHYGQKIALGELREGDLVFFRTYRRGISHVGVYIGDNRFIHAPRTGRSVAVETLTGYYLHRFVTARRLAGTGPPG